ncbi:MAG: tetratricopeptide repeat protein [Ktedonobacteraceae bacterium]|nr:tetratricopeptide repeat protein [Ktedonobacteraceae bacterium]
MLDKPYEQAESLFKRTLAIREQALGGEHPHIATSLHNLALLYRDQARYEQAELLFKRALAISAQALSDEHPDTATTLYCLADLYQAQARPEIGLILLALSPSGGE